MCVCAYVRISLAADSACCVSSEVFLITRIQISWQFLTHIELYAKELINKGCYGVHKLL